MLKKMFTMFLVLTTASVVTAFAGLNKVERTHPTVAPEAAVSSSTTTGISGGVKVAPKMEKVSGIPGTRSIVGTTAYDLFCNYGAPTFIVYYKGHTSMIYINAGLAAANRSIQYVYYDGTTFTTPQDVVNPATQTTYFSAIDVWRGGDLDGFAGIAAGATSGGTSYYGLEASLGGGNFTTTAIAPYRDAATLTLDSVGTVLFKDSKGRTNYEIWKSTDFGATFTNVDTAVYNAAPAGQTLGTYDIPLIRYPDGSVGIPCMITGTGLVPNPAWGGSTATQDSSTQTGFFKSTDQGKTWTWNRVGRDGEQFTPGFYNSVGNWGGQVDMVVDNNGKEHMAIDGDAAFIKVTGSDTSSYETMDMLYWDKTNGFKSVVNFNRNDTLINYYTSGNTRASNNTHGCSFPSVAISDDGQTVVVLWSQEAYSNGHIDTMATGCMRFDLWYNASFDGGATWGTAQNLSQFRPGLESAIQSSMADHLEQINSTTWRARVIYLGDLKGAAASTDTVDNVYYHEFDVVNSGTAVHQTTVTPNKFELVQNYPNPFNPSTKISYSISKNALVTLKVYDVLGREVATLVNTNQAAGDYSVNFDASHLASGMYIYKLESGSFASVKKMMLLK